MRNKKAKLMDSELGGIVLAAGVVFLLFFLLYQLISPNFDKNKETAKSYFDTLIKEIEKSDKGQAGEFLNWDNENIYLIYFGREQTYTLENKRFIIDSSHLNYICMCYVSDDKTSCSSKACSSLKYSAQFGENLGMFENFIPSDEKGRFIIRKGEKVFIEKKNDKYIFRRA